MSVENFVRRYFYDGTKVAIPGLQNKDIFRNL